MTYFEKKKHCQYLRKFDVDVEKPSCVKVRVLDCIVKVFNPFL
jgi:hypothetical protein